MIPALASLLTLPDTAQLSSLFNNWRLDAMEFIRRDVPKLIFVLVVAIVLIRVLRVVTLKIAGLRTHRVPTGLRGQQVRTLAGVINGLGSAVVLFVASLEALSLLGLNLGPSGKRGIVDSQLDSGANSGSRCDQWFLHFD
jgi:small conductance mechanosensitive channel